MVQLLELIQALNSYHGLTQSHSLKFAKKESLDLVHGIILSDHCSINLRPWNHNQLTHYSHQNSSGITPSWACAHWCVRSCVCFCTLDLRVVLCLVLLAFDGQLYSIARQIHFLCTWFLEGKEEALYKDEKVCQVPWQCSSYLNHFIAAALMENWTMFSIHIKLNEQKKKMHGWLLLL